MDDMSRHNHDSQESVTRFSMKYILGLDISTSVVGAAIVDPETLALKGLFYVNLTKEKGMINKISALKIELEKYTPMIGHVAIEEPLVMFKEGFSRAQVLSLLSQFNGMCQFLTFLLYKSEPVMYNVNSARKLSYGDLKFPKGCKRKELVQERSAKEYPDIDWPMKKTGRLKDECFDMADAIVIARAHAVALKNATKTAPVDFSEEEYDDK